MLELGLLHSLPTPTNMLMASVRRFAQRTAFQTPAGEVTYSALGDMVGRIALVLKSKGIPSNRAVAILSRNRWEAWAAASAVSAIGAAPCWLHLLGTVTTHIEQAIQIKPTAIIIDPTTFADRVDLIAEQLSGIPVFTLGRHASGIDLLHLADTAGSVSLVDLSKPGGLGMVGLTGGTTGASKAVERAVSGVSMMTIATLASFDLPLRPSFLAIAPISHVTGTKILPTLMRGGCVTLLDRFEPEEVLNCIERQKISFSLAVPTMIYDLLDCGKLERFNTSSLSLLLYGGAAMSPHRLSEGLERIGPVFNQLYGQAECYPIATLGPEDHEVSRPDILASCGFPTRGSEICLLDDENQIVREDGVGEICVRSPSVMTGYANDPALTAEAFAGGWLHTGDIGKLDEQGRLYIVDRKKDMIVSGGFNIYPREIEDALTSHPEIASASVVGVPHSRWGEALHAVVVMRKGCKFDEQDLKQFVRSRKGAMLTPKSIDQRPSLPLTAAGKVDKRALVAEHLEKSGLQPG